MDKFTHNLRKLIEIQGLSAAMGSISAMLTYRKLLGGIDMLTIFFLVTISLIMFSFALAIFSLVNMKDKQQ
ncbi:hypothetical protein KUA25_04505 [Bacteroidales bacterium MSK.15.36]|nr:hypothetical protein [Bacteroidales bacterium MSK.15.36]